MFPLDAKTAWVSGTEREFLFKDENSENKKFQAFPTVESLLSSYFPAATMVLHHPPWFTSSTTVFSRPFVS